MDRWMDGWMDGWTDGWIDGFIPEQGADLKGRVAVELALCRSSSHYRTSRLW